LSASTRSGRKLTAAPEIDYDKERPTKREIAYKTMAKAQKKPLVETNGEVRLQGFEPWTYGLKVNEPIDVNTDSQTLTATQDSRGSTEGSNSNEPVSQIASDAILADLIGDDTAALDSTLPSDIRFVVNH
jgi:hypothetical protein